MGLWVGTFFKKAMKMHRNSKRLYKQQAEQCYHLAILSELIFAKKKFDGDNVKDGPKNPGKTHRNSSIN